MKRARLDPYAAIPRSPSGSPAYRLDSQVLQIELPRPCCCCLGNATRFLDVTATQTDVAWARVFLTVVGVLTAVVTGFGWYYRSHAETYSSTLKVPICPACLRHESLAMIARYFVIPITIGGCWLSFSRKSPATAGAFFTTVGMWIALGSVLAFASCFFLRRIASACCGRTPVRVSWKSDGFRIVFGNHAYGERAVAINSRPGWFQ